MNKRNEAKAEVILFVIKATTAVFNINGTQVESKPKIKAP